MNSGHCSPVFVIFSYLLRLHFFSTKSSYNHLAVVSIEISIMNRMLFFLIVSCRALPSAVIIQFHSNYACLELAHEKICIKNTRLVPDASSHERLKASVGAKRRKLSISEDFSPPIRDFMEINKHALAR